MGELKAILFVVFKKIYNYLIKIDTIKKIPGIYTVYNFLFGVIWPHKNIIEIRGSKMYVNIWDKDPLMRKTFQSYALAFGEGWEASTSAIFERVVKEGDIIVDLGANIGYFTLLAAKIVGGKGRVYSFEPEPRNYNYLLKNIELNDYKNVVPVQKAVADKVGKTRLYICPYDSGHHTINQYQGIKKYKPDVSINEKDFVEVEMITLDDFFGDKDQSINVIKMDIEGAEMLAFLGMARIIKKNKNLKIFMEFFPLLIREMGSSPEEFIKRILEDYHFSMYIIGGDYSMREYASNKKYLKIDKVDKLMNFCKGEKDHVNLFLEKGEKIFEKLF